MFWGFISWDKIGYLIEVDNLNSETYIVNILEPFLKTWRIFRKKRKLSQFMQDNAPCHKSKRVLNWFGQKKVDVLEWPPQSPDLNPIETIWNDLSLAVRKRRDYPKSLNDLRIAIQEEWRQISSARIKRLYETIPDRLREVKKMKGHATKY